MNVTVDAPPVVRTVTLTMTEDEATKLRAMMGSMDGRSRAFIFEGDQRHLRAFKDENDMRTFYNELWAKLRTVLGR